MGAWRRVGKAAAVLAVLAAATRSGASTQVEPIARLSLEGGYDSNALYDGNSADSMGRVSPEVGVRLRDHRWESRLEYRGDYVRYQELAPGGIFNHHASLTLDARPTRRTEVSGALRGSYAFDPVGLAQAGVFRTGRQSALFVGGAARAQYAWSRRLDVAATLQERTVLFEDGTGGAMHAPGVEALWGTSRRLALGGAYGFSTFQSFETDGDELAFAHAVKARARFRFSRRVDVDASAGPALWLGPDGSGVVPELSLDVLGSSRAWHWRLTAAHRLGIGSTARPGLVDALEAAGERRFRRRYHVRGAGGLWHSGRAPSGGDAVTGYAVDAEAGMLVGMNVSLALGATHFSRLDDASPEFRRTTVALRLGWALPTR